MFIPAVQGGGETLELYGFPLSRIKPVVRNRPGLYVHVTFKLSNGDTATFFVQEVAGKWEPNGLNNLRVSRGVR